MSPCYTHFLLKLAIIQTVYVNNFLLLLHIVDILLSNITFVQKGYRVNKVVDIWY